ncbi:hypothetical protein DQ04_02951050 [Trypanosoma grayi]|uniref:hypothetical protein n=1 Tax=Trypanosoma grayi TaxID=71804 RepID=UPI0004F43E6A|nr:hypothetical protein DQ04_02951050 [Trypanosoma grayi]KEG11127.1 hypothetical protein DQ04_02951050 [Trypanosoma grayi]
MAAANDYTAAHWPETASFRYFTEEGEQLLQKKTLRRITLQRKRKLLLVQGSATEEMERRLLLITLMKAVSSMRGCAHLERCWWILCGRVVRLVRVFMGR